MQMRIHAIDGLRAIAMTMVIAQHCGLLPFGWAGVWLFFVISGYVITKGFVSGLYREGTPISSYWTFMGRRAIRIVPVYLLYLSVCIFVALAIDQVRGLSRLPFLLTFVYNWHMIHNPGPYYGDFACFEHLWTLSIEQQFYVAFGLFALLLPARTQLIASLLVIAAGPLIRGLWSWMLDASLATDPGRHAFAVYAATHCHADAFLMGSVIARLEPVLRRHSHAVTLATFASVLVATCYASAYVMINRTLGATGSTALRNVFSGILYGQHREVFVYLSVGVGNGRETAANHVSTVKYSCICPSTSLRLGSSRMFYWKGPVRDCWAGGQSRGSAGCRTGATCFTSSCCGLLTSQ